MSAFARSLLRWSAACADGSMVCTPTVTVITSGVPSTSPWPATLIVGPGVTAGVVAAVRRTGVVVFELPLLQPATPTAATVATAEITVLVRTRIDVPFVGG